MYNKMKVACPTYFKKFSCIGGKCENTCCKAWDIEIDKNTFEQYNAITDENAKLMLKKNIQVNEECISSDLDYGLIKLDHEEMCPFLDKINIALFIQPLAKSICQISVHIFQEL